MDRQTDRQNTRAAAMSLYVEKKLARAPGSSAGIRKAAWDPLQQGKGGGKGGRQRLRDRECEKVGE